MVSKVQLYEALRSKIGEEAAAMVAESVPQPGDLATKADLAEVRADFAGLRAEFSEFRAELKGVEARLMRWMLTFFVPLWLGVYGTLIALLVMNLR